jgi:hypothetical protein
VFWDEFLIILCPIPLTFFLVAANISHPFRPSPSWLVCWLFAYFQSSRSETKICPTSRHKCWHVERSVSQRSGIRRSHLRSGVVHIGTASLHVCLASSSDCRNSGAQTRVGFKLNATDDLHDKHSDNRTPRRRNFTIASLTHSQITGQDASIGTITVTRKIRAIRSRFVSAANFWSNLVAYRFDSNFNHGGEASWILAETHQRRAPWKIK